MRFQIKTAALELVEGDITDQDTEAIVNAANSSLLGGGGVDGAIHRARYVIHAVGPIYRREGAERSAELLASAYQRSLEVATKHGVQSLAFPAISTGAYGYPLDEGALAALQTVIDYLTAQEDNGIRLVRFVLFSRQAYQVFQRVLTGFVEDAAQV